MNEIEFLKQWKDDVMESLCKFDASSVEEVYQLGIKRGRADAINEVVKLIKSEDFQNGWLNADFGMIFTDYLSEQLKEQKNE